MKGVTYNKRNNTWIVRMNRLKQHYYVGAYSTEEDANLAYEINKSLVMNESIGSYETPAKRKPKSDSGFKYVTWSERTGKWAVYIPIDGRRKFFGNFVDQKDAIAVVKRKLRYSNRICIPKYEFKTIEFLVKDEVAAMVKVRSWAKFGWDVWKKARLFDTKNFNGENSKKKIVLRLEKKL